MPDIIIVNESGVEVSRRTIGKGRLPKSVKRDDQNRPIVDPQGNYTMVEVKKVEKSTETVTS